jgi:MFS superfamily sulfate permease-like transporter
LRFPKRLLRFDGLKGSGFKWEFLRGRLRFDRNELAGSFGDIGTDLPLIAGMILVCGLDPASVLVTFGAMQVFTGVVYGVPMPVQPLKAMAVIAITQKVSGDIVYGGGLAIGVLMLVLSATGILDVLVKAIPKAVVRGIQFGLGLSLASLALKDYLQSDGMVGYIVGLVSLLLLVALRGNRKVPPALAVIGMGAIYAFATRLDIGDWTNAFGIHLPQVHIPDAESIVRGFWLLALPQVALSISNSVVATVQTVKDLFPEKPVTPRRIGLTYSAMNLVSPWFGGIPVCHGSGGLMGHYGFGARTGGSVLIYGAGYIAAGLLFAGGFKEILNIFPMPVLGIVLLFEGLGMMSLLREVAQESRALTVALLVGSIAFAVPQGFLVGLAVGWVVDAIWRLFGGDRR